MRHSLIALPALALFLSACSSGGTIYHAPGVEIASRDADLATCQSDALRQYPVDRHVRYTQRYFVPGRRVCNSNGNCYVTAPRWEGGRPYTVDTNAERREVATRGCMASRGYTRVGLPACEAGTAVQLSTAMPPLTAATCLVQRGDGPGIPANPVPRSQ